MRILHIHVIEHLRAQAHRREEQAGIDVASISHFNFY